MIKFIKNILTNYPCTMIVVTILLTVSWGIYISHQREVSNRTQLAHSMLKDGCKLVAIDNMGISISYRYACKTIPKISMPYPISQYLEDN